MAAKAHNLVVGVFEQPARAERAVEALWEAGFPQDRIDMATRDQGVVKGTDRLAIQKDAADGAVTGAVAGARAGAVAGALVFLLVPGLGAVIGGGLLLGVLGGAALGAAGGTFLGPFISLEMSEAEARHYSRQIDEGRTLVLVQTKNRREEARRILQEKGAATRYDFPTAASVL
jgi:uncharacterized membrane protein